MALSITLVHIVHNDGNLEKYKKGAAAAQAYVNSCTPRPQWLSLQSRAPQFLRRSCCYEKMLFKY